ncbi:MAG: nicotinate-nucleotide adenylyltransferase [Chitinophagales bacterium]|nr:nicotinate-nucleotide adenylyltransferase [Chitinophagales bacterium]
MKIGLFFGSFNPVHNGHLMIANYLQQTSDLDKVWLVVSPQNPLKEKDSLLNQYDRLNLIQLAIDDNPNLKVSNIEFSLPKPSYTIDTLTHLKEKYPAHQFCLIMGSDNLASIHKWKNYEMLLKDYEIYVYKRRGYEVPLLPNNAKVHVADFPFIDISATFIRNNLRDGISMQYFLPEKVWQSIEERRLYRPKRT